MRKRLVAILIVASVLCAAPAEAQVWRWLEKLSGPGDFTGYEVDLKLLCRYDVVKDAAGRPVTDRAVLLPCLTRRVADHDNKPRSEVSGSELVIIDKGEEKTIDLARREFALGVAVSYLRGRNDLPVARTDETIDRTIQLVAFEGFFDRRIHNNRVDVGVAFGPNIFIVPAAENFVRWSIEPRVSFKLFDLRRGNENRYLGTAAVKVGLLAFFGDFTAADFGAIGSFRSGREVRPSVRFIFDFDRNPFSSR